MQLRSISFGKMVLTCVLGCSWTTPDAKGFYAQGLCSDYCTRIVMLFNHTQMQRYFLHICSIFLQEICMYANTSVALGICRMNIRCSRSAQERDTDTVDTCSYTGQASHAWSR